MTRKRTHMHIGVLYRNDLIDNLHSRTMIRRETKLSKIKISTVEMVIILHIIMYIRMDSE